VKVALVMMPLSSSLPPTEVTRSTPPASNTADQPMVQLVRKPVD
jgi:hypothetical protein